MLLIPVRSDLFLLKHCYVGNSIYQLFKLMTVMFCLVGNLSQLGMNRLDKNLSLMFTELTRLPLIRVICYTIDNLILIESLIRNYPGHDISRFEPLDSQSSSCKYLKVLKKYGQKGAIPHG